jgi:hypothetical protein
LFANPDPASICGYFNPDSLRVGGFIEKLEGILKRLKLGTLYSKPRGNHRGARDTEKRFSMLFSSSTVA